MGLAVPAGNFGQHLFRCLEREIMQEERHFLPVSGDILGPTHDKRGGEQLHFLDGDMAVHPMGAGKRCKIVAARFARDE